MNTILILLLSAYTASARYGQPTYCTTDGMTHYALEGDLYEMIECTSELEPPELTTDMLVAASCRGQYNVVVWLLEKGVQVHSNRDDIMCAAGLGYTGIVQLILAKDAEYLGRPFFFAVANGHIGVTNVMLKAGADPNQSVHCYYEIKHAPMQLYDGFKDSVPTCDALVDSFYKNLHGQPHGCGQPEHVRSGPYADEWLIDPDNIIGMNDDVYYFGEDSEEDADEDTGENREEDTSDLGC